MPSTDLPPSLANIKALAFDVFGTVVNWRASVVAELTSRAEVKLQAGDAGSSLISIDWLSFACAWRAAYISFVAAFDPETTPWRDIDTFHHDSLLHLLEERGLSGVYSEAETRELSLVWHRLAPWPDSPAGLAKLRALGQQTATLSNGNTALLQDLNTFGNLGFQHIISAADFRAYKPHPRVYLGAAEKLGLEPGQVALVAAHLGDLRAARACGLRTIYVERELEERWEVGSEEYEAAREWVDLWVPLSGGKGFLEVAEKLGMGVSGA